MGSAPSNERLATALTRVAELLEAQGADIFRIRAYDAAAQSLRELDASVAKVAVDHGLKGLEALPNVGASIGAALQELVHTGRLGMLERLEGQVSPEDAFIAVAGIGESLAKRIHDELHVDTLEELEVAAHDGRLAAMHGIGERKLRAARDSLAMMLSRSARRRARHLEPENGPRPSVDLLLETDIQYRSAAAKGALTAIAPRRMNPSGAAWLPVMHRHVDGWHLTVMFSNTARAHRLGRTRDWVVMFQERDGHEEQCTVVTEHRGPLTDRRVVRGREQECAAHYDKLATAV